jgi:hypothetical protein
MSRVLLVGAVVLSTAVGSGHAFDSAADRAAYAARVRGMIDYSWSSYLHYGFPMDELTPLSCGGRDTWGSYVRAPHPSISLSLSRLVLWIIFHWPARCNICYNVNHSHRVYVPLNCVWRGPFVQPHIRAHAASKKVSVAYLHIRQHVHTSQWAQPFTAFCHSRLFCTHVHDFTESSHPTGADDGGHARHAIHSR